MDVTTPLIPKARNNMCLMCIVLWSVSLDAEKQKCRQMKWRMCTTTLKEDCVQNRCSVNRITHADNNIIQI